jgi:hypothetical protein
MMTTVPTVRGGDVTFENVDARRNVQHAAYLPWEILKSNAKVKGVL